MKCGFKFFILLLFFTSYSDVALPYLVREVTEETATPQSQTFTDKSESNVQAQTVQKDRSKSRKRMTAGKIAGLVILVIVGAFILGMFIIPPVTALFLHFL
jgi:hypothetical protein